MTNEQFEKIKEKAKNRSRKLDGSDPYALSIITTFGVTRWFAGAIQIRALMTNLPQDKSTISGNDFYSSEESIQRAVEDRIISSELAPIALVIIKHLSIAVAFEPFIVTVRSFGETGETGKLINNL